MTRVRVMRYALQCGAQEYAAIYTWKTWLCGWFVRVLAQVMFFALLGRLLQSAERTWFLLVGNAVMLAAMEGVWALNMVSWERNCGTITLLAASPTSPVLVLASRGTYLIIDGTVSAIGALLAASTLLGLPLPWPEFMLVVPLTGLVAASAYCFGTFLGGILFGFRSLSGIVANVSLVVVMTLCGVNVPLDAYPEPVAWLAGLLPLTHGLVAIREALAGDLAAAGWRALAEACVGAGWLCACVFTFGRLVRQGRHSGSLDYIM